MKNPSWKFFVCEKFIRNFLFTPLMTSHDDEQLFIFKRFSEFFISPPRAVDGGNCYYDKNRFFHSLWTESERVLLFHKVKMWEFEYFSSIVFFSHLSFHPCRLLFVCQHLADLQTDQDMWGGFNFSCNRHISIQFHLLLNAEETAMVQ